MSKEYTYVIDCNDKVTFKWKGNRYTATPEGVL